MYFSFSSHDENSFCGCITSPVLKKIKSFIVVQDRVQKQNNYIVFHWKSFKLGILKYRILVLRESNII